MPAKFVKTTSMNMIGNKYVADFGKSKAILYFETPDRLTFTITEKDGEKVNIIETVNITLSEIRPGLFMVTWKETSGTTVTQVHDYQNNMLYSSWTAPAGDFKQSNGTLTPYTTITVHTNVNATLQDCWRLWTNPPDILKFNNPFEDWHTAEVNIDVKTGGRFYYRMEAKDGGAGFDFAGTYTKVIDQEFIESVGDDGRKTVNTFISGGEHTVITEIVEPDLTAPLYIQRNFCQSILDNFKKYAERQSAIDR